MGICVLHFLQHRGTVHLCLPRKTNNVHGLTALLFSSLCVLDELSEAATFHGDASQENLQSRRPNYEGIAASVDKTITERNVISKHKDDEDPAYFISRLKMPQNAAMSANDLAESS